MAKKSTTRRSYARPPVTRYHCNGFNIDLVPENTDSQKWKVYRETVMLGHFATIGASRRAIAAYRASGTV